MVIFLTTPPFFPLPGDEKNYLSLYPILLWTELRSLTHFTAVLSMVPFYGLAN